MDFWRRTDANAGIAVARLYGEIVLITPRASVSDYAPASPDPERPEFRVRAVFSEETSVENLRGQRVSGESRGTTNMVSSESAIQIMATTAALLPCKLDKHDLVTLISRPDKPSYSISLADPLDNGDLVLYLSPEKVL